MKIAETFKIDAPVEKVWPLLADPVLVASCIPGATLEPAGDDGAYRGTMTVKFGPTVVTFRGEAKLAYDHAARRCAIEGRGLDQRGASRATASGSFSVSGSETTEVAVEGQYHVAGPLEAFARTGGVHVARALIAEFVARMSQVVDERRGAPEPRAQKAAELNAAALLWRAFLDWARKLLRR
jgi:uncharacterized protein